MRYATALRHFRPLAKRGNFDAQFEAARWYRKAAEWGHAKAQNRLGDMYRWGWGVIGWCHRDSRY
jgi:TPR repeat protein